jgi:hypothetical protein
LPGRGAVVIVSQRRAARVHASGSFDEHHRGPAHMRVWRGRKPRACSGAGPRAAVPVAELTAPSAGVECRRVPRHQPLLRIQQAAASGAACCASPDQGGSLPSHSSQASSRLQPPEIAGEQPAGAAIPRRAAARPHAMSPRLLPLLGLDRRSAMPKHQAPRSWRVVWTLRQMQMDCLAGLDSGNRVRDSHIR